MPEAHVDGGISIDDFVAQLEADGAKDDLEAARRWVGETYYPANEGVSLAGLRLRSGLTQRALALALGTSQSDIARMESGLHAPNNKRTIGLAKVFGVSEQDVINAVKVAQAGRRHEQS